MRVFVSGFSFMLFLQTACIGQLRIPELSPAGSVKQNVGFTAITVIYERPAARNRKDDEVFGKLVPLGNVWRTGAGSGTKISFSTDVFIGGKTVHKGTYSLYTIPDKTNWTVILNTDTVNGPYAYDNTKDAVRVDVKPQQSTRFYESLTIDIDVISNDAKVYVSWLNTSIAFDVRTGTDKEVLSFIRENLILRDSNDPALYDLAIFYYRWHGLDGKQIMIFIEKGIALENHRRWYYWKVSQLMKDKKYDEALSAAETAIDLIRKSPHEPGYTRTELIKDFENWIGEIKAEKMKFSSK